MSRHTQDTAIAQQTYLYGAFTLFGRTFQSVPVRRCLNVAVLQPRTCRNRYGLGLLPVRSPLLRKSMFLSFPPPTKMFQFRGLASVAG